MSDASTIENHIPIDEWPDVSKMLEGFGEPSLPASNSLNGSTLVIRFEDGSKTTLVFKSIDELHVLDEATAIETDCTYRAVEVRDGIFYVDYLAGTGPHAHNFSFVYDQATGQVTSTDSFMYDRAGEIRTETIFRNGSTTDGAIAARNRTEELVGLRIYYRYSPTEHYEHVYLSPGTFVWHCIKGGERGLADADETRAFELADGIVIFYWKETVMPVESFLVVDLKNERSIGRMFCWDAPSMDLVHLPFDSKFTILNRTTYPEN